MNVDTQTTSKTQLYPFANTITFLLDLTHADFAVFATIASINLLSMLRASTPGLKSQAILMSNVGVKILRMMMILNNVKTLSSSRKWMTMFNLMIKMINRKSFESHKSKPKIIES